jgi:hypothetical protein
MKMKDLSNYIDFHDDKFWIETECELNLDAFMGDDESNPPFEVNVPFEFTLEDGVSRIGVVECDDGVDEFAMIPFRVVEQ